MSQDLIEQLYGITLFRCAKCNSNLTYKDPISHPKLLSCMACGHLFHPTRMSPEARKALAESPKTMWWIEFRPGYWIKENACGAVELSSERRIRNQIPKKIQLGQPLGAKELG